ncbi:sulfatase-like hydrolase/transferase [Helicobacter sp. 12S02634-8]|uniref:phosphoethanolamine transferase n=1 Tax=Helicobacter sp. 12S02634-8 TaxID=1476199 RepID=UPI000BA53D65|nr:sulfatase-like hydrolase/transferase [Helicobacter sp. 12S02634-8]
MQSTFFRPLSYHWVIFIAAVVLAGLYNDTFWTKIFAYVSMEKEGDKSLLFALFAAYVLLIALSIELLSVRLSVKWVIGALVVISGVSQYFMQTLDITINDMVIESLLHTNTGEIKDFLSWGLVGALLLYVALPLCLLFFCPLGSLRSFWRSSALKLALIVGYLIALSGLYLWKGADIVFAFKSSKPIIYATNPFAPIRSGVRVALDTLGPAKHFVHIGADAKLVRSHQAPSVFVLVIGESARAANFSLNGYARDTNPYTSKLKSLVNFTNFYACGVITAISIPCMLTNYTHQTYKSRNQSLYVDNILDIAQRVGYQTYWISNNGGGCMGGVCARIEHIKYYNDGSFDGAMLGYITDLIAHTKQDTFIVINLHGSHGPSYFKRYPKNFEYFSPVCEQKELQKCSHESIVNAYDNSIVYTDYFLYQIIHALKENKGIAAAMWYVSDHGESLGEYKQYMHGGLPYALSPETQKHIPSMIWLGNGFKQHYQELAKSKDAHLSHDYIFHTLLDLLDIHTQDYQKDLDILKQ